jgi:hypothetical protein
MHTDPIESIMKRLKNIISLLGINITKRLKNIISLMGINRGFHFSKFGTASSAIYKYNHHTVLAIYHSLLLSPFPHFSQFGSAPTKFYHLWNFIQQNMESTVWSKVSAGFRVYPPWDSVPPKKWRLQKHSWEGGLN